jgi:AcrR family transcriptional regulator
MPRRSQEDRTRSTQALLITTARRLFAERGYAHVSADEIVNAAGLSRGALYHHYADKRDLMRAVFEQLETEIASEITASIEQAPSTLDAITEALGTFLTICQRPEVIQLGLTDAPAVLGWQQWRQIESAHGLGLTMDWLQRAANEGLLVPVPIPVLAQLVLSAAIEAALVIAHSGDQDAARAEAETALLAMLSGLLVHN